MQSNPLLQKVSLLNLIESLDGEITPDIEASIADLEKNLPQYIDSICLYRKRLQAEVDKYKDLIKVFVKVQENKIQALDRFLTPLLEKLGKQQTPLSTLFLRTTESESVQVEDFEMCVRAYPYVTSTHYSSDNAEKTLKISKGTLKEIWKEGKECRHFKVVKTISKSVQVRMKGER